MKKKLLFAIPADLRSQLFLREDESRIVAVCDVSGAEGRQRADKDFLTANLPGAEIVITGWGTAAFDEDVMAKADALRLLVHAAGSVKPVVTEALWRCGVRVTSAAIAIAHGVAEFCLGLIILAPKRAFWAGQAVRQGQWRQGVEVFSGPREIYRRKVGVIGASYVGRLLIRLLKNFECEVLLYDPYCPADEAAQLGARKVETLEEVFSQCLVVSLNAPSTEATRHMIRGRHFRLLEPGAVFINTARGAIVHEQEMIEELRTGRFVACIDVTDPNEPPPADHPLRQLPNVWLTPHEAGAVAENLLRIGGFATDEVEAYAAGRPPRYEVRHQDLPRIA